MRPERGASGNRSIGTGSTSVEKQRSEGHCPATAKGTAPARSDKLELDYNCPLCDGLGKGSATRKPDHDGDPWWFYRCRRAGCPSGDGLYIDLLAEALGVSRGELQYRGPEKCGLDVRKGSNGPPAELPSEAAVRDWHSRLMSSMAREPRRYLLTQRNLSAAILSGYQIGWDGQCFTLPVRDIRTGALINVKRRRWPQPWPGGARYRGLRNRPAKALYPNVPERGPLLLCAGEFDALVLRRHGLPAMTCCSGSGTNWSAEWNDLVAGRKVAVMFDADPREEAQAVTRAAQLRDAGADAWVVRLSGAGLGPKEDVTDWFVRHGRSADELRKLINKARRHRRG